MSRLALIDHLNHMQDAAAFARSYVDGVSQADFLADKKTQHAVLLNVLVLGRSRSEPAEGA